LLGRPLAEVDTVDFELTLTVHEGRWRVALVSIERARDERRLRVLTGNSCTEAADTAAVAISLAIRSAESADGSSESFAEEPGPAAASPKPAEPVPSPAPKDERPERSPAPTRSPVGAVVAASVLIDFGALPRASPGIGVAAGVTWSFLRATALGQFFARLHPASSPGVAAVSDGLATTTLHRSMTTSPIGCAQQTRALPSAGSSSGSGT
jgi:hypothetical protein